MDPESECTMFGSGAKLGYFLRRAHENDNTISYGGVRIQHTAHRRAFNVPRDALWSLNRFFLSLEKVVFVVCLKSGEKYRSVSTK